VGGIVVWKELDSQLSCVSRLQRRDGSGFAAGFAWENDLACSRFLTVIKCLEQVRWETDACWNCQFSVMMAYACMLLW